MKKLSLFFVLAVAFCTLLLASSAVAKEFVIKIGGEQYVAITGADGHVKSLKEPDGKVIEAGDLFSQKAAPAAKKTISHQKREIAVSQKNQAAVPVVVEKKDQQGGTNTPQPIVPKQQNKNSIQTKVSSGNAQIASAQIQKTVPAAVFPNQQSGHATVSGANSDTKTISAPKNICAPNKKSESNLERANKFLAEINGEVPTKQGQEEVGRGFIRLPQDPQDEKDLRSWLVVGNKMIKINPETGMTMEKPIPWGYRILYDTKYGNCAVILTKERGIPNGYEPLKKNTEKKERG